MRNSALTDILSLYVDILSIHRANFVEIFNELLSYLIMRPMLLQNPFL